MAWIAAVGECFGCHRIFSFNPTCVPSIRVNGLGKPDPRGTRRPVCRDCVERANPKRVANGLPPIVPLPGAYEPCAEEELDMETED